MRTVCLVMIVRDEAAVIERCLLSVRELIDSYCIVDTGSSDETVQIIVRKMHGIPGTVHHREWVNFGHNRTEAMQLARDKADWLLLMDADSTGSGFIPDQLDPELAGYLVAYDGDHEWWNAHLVRADLPWSCVGPVHEYLYCGDPDLRLSKLPSLRIRHHADSHANQDERTKFLEHHRLLTEHLKEHPDDARSVFYLAQTCRDLVPHQEYRRFEAIRLYDQRSGMGGWPEEAFYAAFQVGALLLSRDLGAATMALLRAWEMRPTRAEPLYYLGHALRDSGQVNLGDLFLERAAAIPYPEDVLFLHKDAYSELPQEQVA